MKNLRKMVMWLTSLLLCVSMVMLVPVKAMAAEGKISYLEEIQSVSTGDAQPYALMTLNEDYGVMTVADRVFSNSFPDGSKQYLYRPSYQTTVDVLSINFWTGNFTGLTGKNNIRLHLPITINGLSEDDILLKGEVWLNKDGKKYILGNYDNPWLGCILDDLTASDGASMGIDLYLMNREIYDYLYDDMWINPSEYTPAITDTFYHQPRFIVDKHYLDELMRNRGKSRNITISYSGGSYICEYFEREEIGLIKQFKQAMQDQIYSLNVNVTNGLNYVRDIIVTKVDEFIGVINTKFTELFTKMEEDQEELINGYQGSDTPAADEAFTAGADELTQIEGQLSGEANTNIDNYTTAAFDTGVIATLGNSMVYVVTWFTNFWNMGGLFTSILNIGLALYVAFFILRMRGNK